MANRIPSTVQLGNSDSELLFAQIFQRPLQCLTRPAIGVYLWEVDADDQWQVSIAADGAIRSDAIWPSRLDQRMSPVLSLRDAKRLMRQWIADTEDAIGPEWAKYD